MSKTMVTCVSFSFSALPFERAVRLTALLELERGDGNICLESTPSGSGWGGAQPVDGVSEIVRIRDVFRAAQHRWDPGDKGSRREVAP